MHKMADTQAERISDLGFFRFAPPPRAARAKALFLIRRRPLAANRNRQCRRPAATSESDARRAPPRFARAVFRRCRRGRIRPRARSSRQRARRREQIKAAVRGRAENDLARVARARIRKNRRRDLRAVGADQNRAFAFRQQRARDEIEPLAQPARAARHKPKTGEIRRPPKAIADAVGFGQREKNPPAARVRRRPQNRRRRDERGFVNRARLVDADLRGKPRFDRRQARRFGENRDCAGRHRSRRSQRLRRLRRFQCLQRSQRS